MINSLDIFIELNWIKIYPIVGILILVFTKNIVGTRVVKLLIILVFTVFCLYYGGIYWGVIQVAVFFAVSVFLNGIHGNAKYK